MSDKIVFLDFDGVIVTAPNWNRANKDCVDRLNRITTPSNALIVVSSAWRCGQEIIWLREILNSWGVTAPVVGKTPYGNSGYRGSEIQDWLMNARNDISHFVILDDNAGMAPYENKLVQTNWRTGLEDCHVELALAHLGV